MRRAARIAGLLRGGLVSLAVAAIVAPGAPAPAVEPPGAVSGAGFAAWPEVAELSVLGGQTVVDRITVENRSQSPMRLSVSVGDVAPAGSGFEPSLGGPAPDSAAAWIKVDPRAMQMPGGTTTTVTATVRAPFGAQVGGHYAGVRLNGTVTSPDGIETASQVLHTVLIEVPGEGLVRSGRVLSLSMPKLEVNGEVPFRVRVESTGNTYLRVTGAIVVRDRLRRREIASMPLAPFYALPGREVTQSVVWTAPPRLAVIRATARLELIAGVPQSVAESYSSGFVVHWVVIAGVAAGLLLLRLLLGLVSWSRRRAPSRTLPASAPRSPVDSGLPAAPAPAGNGVAHGSSGAPRRSAWDPPPGAGGALALRRTRRAVGMLRLGAGQTGVRIEVALGLLRSVRDRPEVVEDVQAAHAAALRRKAPLEAAAIALALKEVDSPHAAEALLAGYAKADRVLAQRIRRALAQCDPADLRAHPELLDALPATRRRALPVG